MATDSGNPLQQYGYDQETGQALASSLGLSTAQLAAAFAATPMTGGSAPTTTSYGMTTGGQPAGRDLSNTIQQLQLMQAVGGLGQSGSQAGQPPSSTPGGVSQDPINAATNLGAQALGAAGFSGAQGAFPVYNPTPGQINSAKGGVSKVPSPVSASEVPTGPTPNVPSVFGGVASSASPFATPPPTAGGTPTPVTPANAPSVARPATPFATAPAAPGIDVAAHTNALAEAGKALFAHYGGDPNTATHTQIADFHSQLASTIGQYTAGVNQPPSTIQPNAAGVKTMAAGGLVPGRGNQDTVPALLTPGEYVIPKQQAAQMFGGQTPIRMQEGGFVPENDSSDEAPEVRRKRLAVASAAAQSLQNTGTGEGTSQQPSSEAPAAPGGYTGPSAQQLQAMYGGSPSSATPAGGWPAQTPSVAPAYDVPSDPDPDWQYTGQQSTAGATGAGVGGASAAAGVGGVASGLFSGLQSAMNTYAKSIGSWKTEPQEFHAPSAPSAPAAQFTQDDVDQQKKKQNPMLTAQYGYNPYQS